MTAGALVALFGGAPAPSEAQSAFTVSVTRVSLSVGQTTAITVNQGVHIWYKTGNVSPASIPGCGNPVDWNQGLDRTISCPPGTYTFRVNTWTYPHAAPTPGGWTPIDVACGDLYGSCGTAPVALDVVPAGATPRIQQCGEPSIGTLDGCVFRITPPASAYTPEQRARFAAMAQAARTRIIPEVNNMIAGTCGGPTGGLTYVQNKLTSPGAPILEQPITLMDLPLAGLCGTLVDWMTGGMTLRAQAYANQLERNANDPPDPAFDQLVGPAVPPPPDLGDDEVADLVEAILHAYDRATTYLDATVTSAERSQGAVEAEAWYWASIQTAQSTRMAELAANAVDEVSAATIDLQRLLEDVAILGHQSADVAGRSPWREYLYGASAADYSPAELDALLADLATPDPVPEFVDWSSDIAGDGRAVSDTLRDFSGATYHRPVGASDDQVAATCAAVLAGEAVPGYGPTHPGELGAAGATAGPVGDDGIQRVTVTATSPSGVGLFVGRGACAWVDADDDGAHDAEEPVASRDPLTAGGFFSTSWQQQVDVLADEHTPVCTIALMSPTTPTPRSLWWSPPACTDPPARPPLRTPGIGRPTVPVRVEAGASVTIDVRAGATPGPVAVSGFEQPDAGSVEAGTDGTLVYTAPADGSGPDAFDFTLADDHGRTVDGTAHLLVTPASTVRPRVVPGVASVVEGDDGSVVLDLPVTLSAVAAAPVTIDFRAVDLATAGIAVPGADYVAADGTVTFAPGDTSEVVQLTVLGDRTDEPPLYGGEWIVVSFSNPSPNADLDLGLFGLGIGIIWDDDPAPTIRPGAGGVVEGDSGTVVVQVPVTLSNPSATPITVDYRTLDGTTVGIATSGADFDATSGTLTFAPGQTAASVAVTVHGDTVAEPPAYGGEWILVAFSNPSAAATLDLSFFGLGLGIVVDDD